MESEVLTLINHTDMGEPVCKFPHRESSKMFTSTQIASQNNSTTSTDGKDGNLNEVLKSENCIFERAGELVSLCDTMEESIIHSHDRSMNLNDSLSVSTMDYSLGGLRRAMLENNDKSIQLSLLSASALVLTQTQRQYTARGPFYGLPLQVKELIKVYKGIDQLYDWQDKCLNLTAIQEHKNLIYALPTSGGKTLVAEILMMKEVLCYKRNAIFVLPYVAIVQEKVWGLSPFAVSLDFLVEEYAASKGSYPPRKRRRKQSIYIATIEKACGLINSLIECDRINEIGLIVVDELHLLGESGRGATLEALLTKLVFLEADIQIVGMSATIGNIPDLCTFLNAEVYSEDFRPVELVEYVKCNSNIVKINTAALNPEDLLIFDRNIEFNYASTLKSQDPDCVGALVTEVIPTGSCLIFCPSKKNCENVAILLSKVLSRDLLDHRKLDKLQLLHELKDESGSLCSTLAKCIPFGVAYHHSGLTNEERRLIEDNFRAGVICVICCTSTLAAGVNLPAQRVILRQPYIATEFITLSKYKQMVGRAGRAGLGETGDSILICNDRDIQKVQELLMSPMDCTYSMLHQNNYKGLRHLIMSCISLEIANTRRKLQLLVKKTMLSVQEKALGVDIIQITDDVIGQLVTDGALLLPKDVPSEIKNDKVLFRFNSASTAPLELNMDDELDTSMQKTIDIYNDQKLQISPLGCAAIKGNLEFSRAQQLYDDLMQAQRSLVLVDALHLLYVVTPYEIAEQCRPNKVYYYNILCKLDSAQQQTARVLGIDEALVTKLITNHRIPEKQEQILKRFYVTLMLNDLWNEKAIFEVAEKFDESRGIVQSLMTSASSFASNVVNFCDGLEEFWSLSHLLNGMCQRLSHCCMRELVSLMELPAVKQSRAKQLYKAGFRTLQCIASTNAETLMESIEFMSKRVANQLIAAAKMLILGKVENLREEAVDLLTDKGQFK